MSKDKRDISLVLGSGGARGYAHIGVIRWIEQHDLRIASVVGASMGALIGGIHAAGKLDDYATWASAIRKKDIVRLLDFTLSKSGFVDGSRIMSVLKDFVGDREIRDLPVRYTAVASDIAREKEVWISSGPLFEAIRASIALPLFFEPFERQGRVLLDGGILNPVPIAPTFGDPTEFTVAVNLNGPPDENLRRPSGPPAKPPQDTNAMQGLIDRFLDRLKDGLTPGASDGLNMLDIAQQTFDTMQGTIARTKLAAYPPDVVISIPRDVATILEFDRADELIDIGYRAADRQLGQFLERSKRLKAEEARQANHSAGAP
ncbi:MAG: patatin-like phospholipase family protein [Woeseiaceae bacterium]|nr:patatin-like phospholipase family protein [Woeseiaceae bacterium]